jgi:Leucine-rich repeat (LRR) protein/GTPase SAR1 family protein
MEIKHSLDRYPGLRPFRQEEERLFFGRAEEVDNIVNRIQSGDVTVISGQSGVGKTSLVNAGVVPRLVKDNMVPVFIRFSNPEQSPVVQIYSAVEAALFSEKLIIPTSSKNDLSALVNTFPEDKRPILIFDQFEELFLRNPEDRTHAIGEIAQLRTNGTGASEAKRKKNGHKKSTPLRLLFVIRLDRLPLLHETFRWIPHGLNDTFVLKPISSSQARDAIVSPAGITDSALNLKSRPFQYSDVSIAVLIDALTDESEGIDCSRLQLLCQQIERIADSKFRGKEGDIVIQPGDFSGTEGVAKLVDQFYENQMLNLVLHKELRLQEEDVAIIRKLLEEILLSGDIRTSQPEEKVKHFLASVKPSASLIYGISKEEAIINELINLRLIIEVNRPSGRHYLLTHDRLAESIAKARKSKAESLQKSSTDVASGLIRQNKQSRERYLDLGNCGMNEIPVEIEELEWLEELIIGDYFDYSTSTMIKSANSFGDNHISRLPKNISRLVNLRKLVVTGSPQHPVGLTDLSSIAGLINLTDVYLCFTAVTDISAIKRLVKLRLIDLSGTRITDLEPLVKLKRVETLILNYTAITSLIPLSKMASLTTLFFSSTPVNDISDLKTLTNLETLGFANTQVKEIAALATFKKLKVLDLSKNQISYITPIENCTNLETLFLQNTKVSSLKPLANLTNLKVLRFPNTSAKDLQFLSALTALQEIVFSNTGVESLEPLKHLPLLVQLRFRNCSVTHLKPIVHLTALKSFDCLGNPIVDCPADVYETGDIQQVRAYFQAKDLETKSVDLKSNVQSKAAAKYEDQDRRDIKLIVLGNSNAGKTNLVNYLENGTFTGIRNTTHGLEVHRWIPDEKRFPNLKDIAVSIWDFGGQEYYHGAYRLFLSDNALYLLLWCNDSNINGRIMTSLRDNGEMVELENFELRYWLDTIKYYSGNGGAQINSAIKSSADPQAASPEKKVRSRLITLQNKVDDLETDKIRIDQELHERYAISDSFHVSLLKGSNKEEFRQHKILELFTSELEFALQNTADKDSIPSKWQMVRNTILLLRNPQGNNPFLGFIQNNLWITISDFQKVCDGFLPTPLTEDELHTVPRWLDKGGTVVYFPDIPKVSDKIFLRPDLLAETIYKVLNDKVRAAAGEFSAEIIFDDTQVELRNIFLELAQHLELIFIHPVKKNAQQFLAPQYLPEAHPIEDLFKIASHGAWQSDLWVKVPLFYYKKILHGVLLHYAADSATECTYFWKHGIMFIKNGLRVLLKGLYPGNKQYEGVILIGVEKESQKQAALQHEIFYLFQKIMGQKGRTGSRTQPRESSEEEKDMHFHQGISGHEISPEISSNIQVSYDGENYITYKALLENSAEPKIKASNSNTLLITFKFAAILPEPPKKAKKVFLSYSHQNTIWLNRLRTHLAGLRRAKEIETWDDKEILPGDMWDTTIKARIEEADVFILLLSADFIASEYVWNDELPKAFEKFKNRAATVIPILFEPLDLGGLSGISGTTNGQTYKINDFEIIPKTTQGHLKAVSLWDNQEEALSIIAQRIREVIRT